MISSKVSKSAEFNKSVWYRHTCTCLDDNDDINLELSLEEIGMEGEISLSLYQKCDISDRWVTRNIFYEIAFRIKYAFKILFGFDVSYEAHHLIREEDIPDFIKALEEGIKKMHYQRIKER